MVTFVLVVTASGAFFFSHLCNRFSGERSQGQSLPTAQHPLLVSLAMVWIHMLISSCKAEYTMEKIMGPAGCLRLEMGLQGGSGPRICCSARTCQRLWFQTPWLGACDIVGWVVSGRHLGSGPFLAPSGTTVPVSSSESSLHSLCTF